MLRSFRVAVVVFVASITSLAPSDAHALGTLAHRITTLEPSATSTIANLVSFDGRVYFTAEDRYAKTKTGYELWTSDGTAPGTRVFKDIVPGAEGSMPANLTTTQSRLFFTVRDPASASATALWVSDGTPSGTQPVPDAFDVRGIGILGAIGDRLFWTLSTDVGTERAMWVTDGVTSTNLGGVHPNVSRVGSTSGGLLFTTRDGAGTSLWITNGAEAPTKLLALTGSRVAVARQGGALFIFAPAGGASEDEPYALFRSDGTAEGTVLLRDGFESYGLPLVYALSNGRLVFRAKTLDTGAELWTSDGTPEGTRLLVDIRPGFFDGFVGIDAEEFGGDLYFAADDGVHGIELWKTDGTTTGTMMVGDLEDGSLGSNPESFVVAGGRLIFLAGGDLWESDGTAQRTRMVYDGAYIGTVRQRRMAAVRDRVFFAERDDELWVCEVKEDDGAPDAGVDAGPEPADEDAGTHAPPADAGALAAPPTVDDERDACGCRAVGAIGPDLLGRGPALLAAVALAGVVARRRRRRT